MTSVFTVWKFRNQLIYETNNDPRICNFLSIEDSRVPWGWFLRYLRTLPSIQVPASSVMYPGLFIFHLFCLVQSTAILFHLHDMLLWLILITRKYIPKTAPHINRRSFLFTVTYTGDYLCRSWGEAPGLLSTRGSRYVTITLHSRCSLCSLRQKSINNSLNYHEYYKIYGILILYSEDNVKRCTIIDWEIPLIEDDY